jgi:alkylation response protein AidB-like acyl-CoA dehydrogenase
VKSANAVDEQLQDLDEFRTEARSWLEANGELRTVAVRSRRKTTSHSSSGAEDLTTSPCSTTVRESQERAILDAAQMWQRKKFDAGFGMLAWPKELGGRGLPMTYVRAWNVRSRASSCRCGRAAPDVDGTDRSHSRGVRDTGAERSAGSSR